MAQVKFRFMGVPDKAYTVTVIYQKAPVLITGPSSNWSLPDEFVTIYEPLFLSMTMENRGDSRAPEYRQRGIASLLSTANELEQMKISAFLQQFLDRTDQSEGAIQKTQQGIEAQAI